MGGRDCLAIRLVDGTSMRVPRQWTDADGAHSGHEEHKENDFFFTVDSLRRILSLLEAFLSR